MGIYQQNTARNIGSDWPQRFGIYLNSFITNYEIEVQSLVFVRKLMIQIFLKMSSVLVILIRTIYITFVDKACVHLRHIRVRFMYTKYNSILCNIPDKYCYRLVHITPLRYFQFPSSKCFIIFILSYVINFMLNIGKGISKK